jgi:hypothetical protein
VTVGGGNLIAPSAGGGLRPDDLSAPGRAALGARRCEAEVEILERLSGRELGCPDPQLAAGCMARGGLAGEQGLGEAYTAPLPQAFTWVAFRASDA